jgi:hypothetical protein
LLHVAGARAVEHVQAVLDAVTADYGEAAVGGPGGRREEGGVVLELSQLVHSCC